MNHSLSYIRYYYLHESCQKHELLQKKILIGYASP